MKIDLVQNCYLLKMSSLAELRVKNNVNSRVKVILMDQCAMSAFGWSRVSWMSMRIAAPSRLTQRPQFKRRFENLAKRRCSVKALDGDLQKWSVTESEDFKFKRKSWEELVEEIKDPRTLEILKNLDPSYSPTWVHEKRKVTSYGRDGH